MYFSVDRGSIFHERVGSGPPMLVMHGGLGLDHTVFRPWLDAVGGFAELIYYDHLGNGRSETSASPGSLSHGTWVHTADQLRRHLEHERVLLFGHSYGAMLTLEYALTHSEHVSGLVLCNVAPAMDYPDVIMANARRKAPDEATFQALLEVLSGPAHSDDAWERGFRAISPLYFHEYDPARHEPVLDDVRFRAAVANRATFECLPAFDVRNRLEEIRVPTLVLSGADDWIMPPQEAGGRVAAGIAHAEHVIFQKSGHWPFVEENARFVAVLRDWLARTAGRA